MRAELTGVMAGVASVVVFATSAFAAPPAKLAPNDIQTAFFNGQPFTAATTSNVKFKMTFTADGKMKREAASGGGGKGEGTWKLSKDGFCTTWKNAGANCFTVVSAGDNKWSVLKGSTIMATWSK
ncbi:MAG: hypothetical protein WAL80_11870 [Xanthobacteraceae bacterium]|jgi:hypothetical protein